MNVEENLSDSQIKQIYEIEKAGDHLLELIDEVLDLSKIEAGGIKLNIESINLNQLLTECLSLITPLIEKHNISLNNFNSLSDDIYIKADKGRFKQVILNLLSNAVKYNRESGSVTLNTHYIDNTYIHISITDTGIGLKPEDQDHLFVPFDRLDAENTEIEGTGIGLVITRRLVELMEGRIGFESEYGKGSTFWIEVKLAEKNSIVNLSDEKKQYPKNNSRAGTCKILYIEDNPANLRLVEQIVAKQPHTELVTATTPERGIEFALSHKPDLILLDISLPGMSGYEVLKKLKDCDDTDKVPVIAVTANAMESDIHQGLAAGFDKYLTKPINIATLLSVIEQYCCHSNT
ncbi:MAG: ATP-binding protein, partial [Gammaproteobacteria bacterium]|nr:ATP-binding protein [Gammaproteobacteria bacterium]